MSIQSQIQELKIHAQRDRLQIVAILEEAQSAKTPGRPVFNQMLKRIARGEASGILAWHPDRLARNAVDDGQILHLLDTGKLLDLRFPTYCGFRGKAVTIPKSSRAAFRNDAGHDSGMKPVTDSDFKPVTFRRWSEP